jgi:hypothetical protein
MPQDTITVPKNRHNATSRSAGKTAIRCARLVSAAVMSMIPDRVARPVPLRTVGVRKARLLVSSQLCATKSTERRLGRCADGTSNGSRTAVPPVHRRCRAAVVTRAEIRSAAVRHWRRAAAFLCASSGHCTRRVFCVPAPHAPYCAAAVIPRVGVETHMRKPHRGRTGWRRDLAEFHAAQRSTLRPASAESPLD